MVSASLKVVLILLLFISCVNKQEKKNTTTPSSAPPQDCRILIKELIRSSSIKSEIPDDFIVEIDDSTATEYYIKIANRNEETQNDVPIKWIGLNFKKGNVYDITNDLDNPVPVQVNKEELKKVMGCLGK